MSGEGPSQWIVPTEGAKTLPVEEVLTGRGFITGKSGSGKSNTASVIAEELIDNGYNLLVVDPEGEYYGLTEEFDVLHVGKGAQSDLEGTPENAERIARVALEQSMPVILDVSDYLDGEAAKDLIAAVVEALYHKEKDVRMPFLLMIEEMQEYLPQQGGRDDLAELLERVAKRGRKRGLGMLGMSQRPSSVDKDFITQCDWMVWHRLTWKNDLDVVRNILGSDVADEIEDLDTGEAYLMTDWDDEVERVHFKEKRTIDAGATPGLEQYGAGGGATVPTGSQTQTSSGGASAQSDPAAGIQSSSETPASSATTDVQPDGDEPSPGQPAASDPPADHVDKVAAFANTGYDPLEDVAVDDLEEEELRDRAREFIERIEILEGEVAELRSLLATVEANGGAASEHHAGGGPANQSATTRTVPSKPTPPERPEPGEGIAGSIVELAGMVSYGLRYLMYVTRLLGYRVRSGLSSH